MAQSELKTSDPKMRRKAFLSSYLGSTIEYYDFLLYGIAATLVFPHIFFSMETGAATLASFGTLAVGYVARPLGAVFFGHYGDKIGRKKMLMMTLYLMGIASFAMGLLPTHSQIGMLAPVLLVLLRLVQGFAVGGEWAGATLLSMEHAKEKNRGFAASIVGSGAPSGAVLASLVLMPFAAMGGDAFLTWGWRVPFLLSAVLVVIAAYLRRSVDETPDFEAMQAAQKAKAVTQKPRIPLVVVFANYPRQVLLGVLGSVACLGIVTLTATFLMNYAINVGGHSRSTALGLLTLINILHIFTIPGFAILSDRIGRKPVMLAGAAIGVVMIFPVLSMVASGSAIALMAAFAIVNPLVHGMMGGPISAWIGEKFAADIRYSGMSVTFQIGSTISAGFAPLVVTWLLQRGGGTDVSMVGAFYIALLSISALAILLSPESFRKSLSLTTEDGAAARQKAAGIVKAAE